MSQDRNAIARSQFANKQQQAEAARIMRDFLQAVSSGAAAALDRFGQRIEPGSLVLFKPPYDYIYTVKDVTPVMEPGAPAGLVRLHLVLDLPVTVPVNQRQMTMVAVGEAKARTDPAVVEQPSQPPTVEEAPLTATEINDEPTSPE